MAVEALGGESLGSHGTLRSLREIPVAKIRPEDGLSRKRDRSGHEELQQSIAQFGVLTPITVRPADDGSGDYLLIKGQGRTLACRMLGIDVVPAHVIESYDETEKVQQFLVENVARLKMRPVDRALLIHRAREDGEETRDIARRFGVTPTSVRRLAAQLEGVSQSEVKALREGDVSLSVHAVISKHTPLHERHAVVDAMGRRRMTARDVDALLSAIGWSGLCRNYPEEVEQRLTLLSWATEAYVSSSGTSTRQRLEAVAASLPSNFGSSGGRHYLES